MILGVGIDLCEIGRMARAIEKEHFLERVFTPSEAQRIRGASQTRRGQIAAGLFAAKEAVAKALGTGFSGFGPDCVEVMPDGAGRPECLLKVGALDRATRLAGGPVRVWVSITHEAGMAGAVAVLEAEDGGRRDAP